MRRPTFALCLTLLAAVAVTASAAADTQVPTKASLSGQVSANATPISCGVPGVGVPSLVDATGTMSHLGVVDVVIQVTTCSVDAFGLLVMGGTSDITAANGDILHNPSWTFVLDPTTGAFSFTQLVLAGGTGRFANATGSLAGGGAFDLADGSGSWTLQGKISSVGSTQ
jgi:hypothetical protein